MQPRDSPGLVAAQPLHSDRPHMAVTGATCSELLIAPAGVEEDLPQVSILLVDDRPENLTALEASLAPLGQKLVFANSGKAALRAVLQEQFAVILMDVRMPGL